MGDKKIDINLSNIIHEYFDSDISKLTKTNVLKIYNDPKININYENITQEQSKKLMKIGSAHRKYPEMKIILHKKKKSETIAEIIDGHVDGQKDGHVDGTNDDQKDLIKYKDFKGDKYVSFQRKAFIDFINNDFYKKIIHETKKNDFKIYQNFVKTYLAYESPYRGLLVYHGLGTGKSATAITTAEGLSENMEITTLLPASLETNFIEEVKRWRKDIFDLDNNNWVFISELEIKNQTEFRKMIYEKYKISLDSLNTIYNSAKRKTKDNIKIGFWKVSDDIDTDIDKIKTISGKIINNGKDTGREAIILSEGEKLQIEIQIDMMIKYRYNFIHYNPFPKVEQSNIKEFLDKEDGNEFLEVDIDIDAKTNNERIVKNLEEKLKFNKKNYYIDSPFYNETIIIDEVHNFVRQIVNKDTGPSRVFYEWIINAKNIKLICLSGTPVINKPSEIAVLFNMIRGLTRTYNFTIISPDNIDINDIFQKCKDIFYKENSPIDQINVYQRAGKICISFMQNTTRFESIMNPDNRVVYTIQYKNHDFDDFMEYIYKGLHELYTDDNIIPSKKTYDNLKEKDKIDIIKGKIVKFNIDGEMIDMIDKKFKGDQNIRFNIFRKLFTIDTKDDTIDLSDNNNFMDYFFENGIDILDRKRVLLKRMLLGLTSYYPIDRSSIVNMPEIILPKNNPSIYSDYLISKNINIELCQMSSKQFDKYYDALLKDKERNMKFNKKNMYDNDKSDYNINTRRICNMVYESGNFRNIGKKDPNYNSEKEKEYNNLYQSGLLRMDYGLESYSPKINRMLQNISQYNGKGDEYSKGKILFYSEFRADSGAEIFELILQANGYTKFDIKDSETKKYRYTFITGTEDVEERKQNLRAYNDRKNRFGEYVQIMIISGAGAEGISLNCVRQVHILEPYWNYIRIDQVLGRAIRMLSHIGNDKDDPLLPPDKRNVEQYLYLSVFPFGDNIESIYNSLKNNKSWSIPTIEGDIEIAQNLLEHHKDAHDILKKINDVKNENFDTTADQKLFNMMEKKYKLSNVITDVIKESAVDCIQNTRDDINIHHNCIGFDDKLIDENSYYPGLSSDKLSILDNRQIKATFSHYIKPDIYIVSALMENRDIYLYYRLKSKDVELDDIRYIKENGNLIGLLDVDMGYYYMYITDSHELDEKMGTKLSVFQKIFIILPSILSEIRQDIFPNIPSLTKEILGYKIKNNITESFYYYPLIVDKPIMRIYDYDTSEWANFNTSTIDPIIIHNKKFYHKL